MAAKNNAAAAFRRNLAALNLDDDSEQDHPDLTPETTPPAPAPTALSNYAVKQIPFELLEINRFQESLRPGGPDRQGIEELAENMAQNGFTSVILVRPHPDKPGHYEIGHGHRRLAALKLAANLDTDPNKVKGAGKIPARIAENAGDAEWLDIAVSENLSREDLAPLAIANSFEAIRRFHAGASLADIARRVGRSKSWVQRYDAINGAPPHLVELIRQKPDSLEHLFMLKRLPDLNRQKELARRVLSGQLTLAALKEELDDPKQPGRKIEKDKPKYTPPEADTTLESNTRLSRLINQLEVNIGYIHLQLEQENYKITQNQQEKLGLLTQNLTELLSYTFTMTRQSKYGR
jgi:ParB family chromosome partitioning protein